MAELGLEPGSWTLGPVLFVEGGTASSGGGPPESGRPGQTKALGWQDGQHSFSLIASFVVVGAVPSPVSFREKGRTTTALWGEFLPHSAQFPSRPPWSRGGEICTESGPAVHEKGLVETRMEGWEPQFPVDGPSPEPQLHKESDESQMKVRRCPALETPPLEIKGLV